MEMSRCVGRTVVVSCPNLRSNRFGMYLYRENIMAAESQGNTVVVHYADEFERLLVHPASISGWYDPEQRVGVVLFPTPAAAQAARREA